MKKKFFLVVVTPQEPLPGEVSIIKSLLDAGADAVYLRKEAGAAAGILDHVDTTDHPRLIIPHTVWRGNKKYEACILHFRQSEQPQMQEAPGTVRISTSIHSLAELPFNREPDYVFFSPVFSSISKPGYGPVKPVEEFITSIRMQKEKHPWLRLIALGGINAANIVRVRDAGFDGAAMLGSIWQAPDPLKAFAAIKSVCS